MPVTPFHGGIGLLAKAGGGGRFSFLAFCATQVAIDLESGFYLLRDEWPFHRFFHTFLGATIVCSIVVLVIRWLGTWWPGRSGLAPTLSRFVHDDLAALRARGGAMASAALGVIGHVIPDGVMHADVRPFAPITDGNPFFGLVSLAVLHAALVVGGLVGGLVWLVRAVGAERPPA
jgi:hypothetical protein